jgi:hypothetical protein
MEPIKVEELIAKYNVGLADPVELQQLERLIEDGKVELTQLRDLGKLDEQLVRMEPPRTSLQMDDRFYRLLASEKKKSKSTFSFSWPEWNWLAPRLAFTLVLIAAGFSGGYWFQKPSDTADVAELTQQVSDLKEMMMLSLLEKESASERLKAVSLTSEMDNVSQKVTIALFQTLNNDDKVNVRLAALDALRDYAKDGKVREELIRSIAQQDSPLVQVALAELMAALQEKKSVDELKKIMNDENTPSDVKNKIKESIQVLI